MKEGEAEDAAAKKKPPMRKGKKNEDDNDGLNFDMDAGDEDAGNKKEKKRERAKANRYVCETCGSTAHKRTLCPQMPQKEIDSCQLIHDSLEKALFKLRGDSDGTPRSKA